MRQRRAFTLIEMLVVIAIIGVLAGILVPAVIIAKRKAKVAATQTELRNIDMALSNYMTDYARMPMDCNNILAGPDGGTTMRRKSGALLVSQLAPAGASAGDIYYEFEPDRLVDVSGSTVFVDKLGQAGRTFFWYAFDNNDDDDAVSPNPPSNPIRPNANNWNITNVKRTACDIWSAGYDGDDYVVFSDGTSTLRGSDFVTYGSGGTSALDDQDDLGNW